MTWPPPVYNRNDWNQTMFYGRILTPETEWEFHARRIKRETGMRLQRHYPPHRRCRRFTKVRRFLKVRYTTVMKIDHRDLYVPLTPAMWLRVARYVGHG